MASYPVPTKPWLVTTLFRTILKLFYGLEARGLEHLPYGRGAIFAPNHGSYIDAVAVNVVHDHPMNFMAKQNLFKGWFGKKILSYGAFPVKLGENDSAAYKMTLASLIDGNWCVLFPEGGRTTDGMLQPLKEGVARLAMKADVPIVPVRIDGAWEAWSRNGFRPWGKVTVTFFPPIEPPQGEIKGAADREAAVNELLGKLREKIAPPAAKQIAAPVNQS